MPKSLARFVRGSFFLAVHPLCGTNPVHMMYRNMHLFMYILPPFPMTEGTMFHPVAGFAEILQRPTSPGTIFRAVPFFSGIFFVRLVVLYTSSCCSLATYMSGGRDGERCVVDYECLDIPKSMLVTPPMIGSSKHIPLLGTLRVDDTNFAAFANQVSQKQAV